MRIHKSSIPTIVATYMEQHVMSKATGWTKVGCGAVMYLTATKLSSIINNPDIENLGKTLGLIDDTGSIDMDYVRELAINSVKSTEGKFPPILGFSLDSSDIDLVYNIASQYSTGA